LAHGFDTGLVKMVDRVHAHHVGSKYLLVAPGDLQITGRLYAWSINRCLGFSVVSSNLLIATFSLVISNFGILGFSLFFVTLSN
jgi:hypothetical protein